MTCPEQINTFTTNTTIHGTQQTYSVHDNNDNYNNNNINNNGTSLMQHAHARSCSPHIFIRERWSSTDITSSCESIGRRSAHRMPRKRRSSSNTMQLPSSWMVSENWFVLLLLQTDTRNLPMRMGW